MPELTEFQTAYVVAMLWSTTGENDAPLDDEYSIEDLAPEAIDTVIADCNKFLVLAAPLLELAGDEAQNGHDFWLTRNGHGAGFWDRGYSSEVGDALTAICESFGEQWPYVGDNGRVYI